MTGDGPLISRKPSISHGNDAIAALELIFNSAVRRDFHLKLPLRLGLFEYRALWTVDRSRQRAHLGDLNSIERRARQA